MIETMQLVAYLDELLNSSGVPDYPGAVNGLQFDNKGSIRKIAAAVDFSSRTVSAAIEQAADLLLVHHGMFWSGTQPIVGPVFARLRALIEHDVAVYSSHLPLDCHATFGNNVLLSRALGLDPTGEFAQFKANPIGVCGESDIPTSVLVERARHFASDHDSVVVVTPFIEHAVTRKWAVCTGAGASADTLQEAAERGIDTLIVGEGPHWTAVAADDLGITVIYAGHYATEILGVRAVAEHLAKSFDLDWFAIHAPTGR